MKCMNMISRGRDHSEGLGVGINYSLEPFRKFIRFGSVTRPLDYYDYKSLFKVPKIFSIKFWISPFATFLLIHTIWHSYPSLNGFHNFAMGPNPIGLGPEMPAADFLVQISAQNLSQNLNVCVKVCTKQTQKGAYLQ